MASHSSATSVKGRQGVQATLPQSPISHSQSSRTQTPFDEKVHDHMTVEIEPVTPTPVADPLSIFHDALGIPPAIPPSPPFTWFGFKKPGPSRPANPKAHLLSQTNKGVYHDVRSCERWSHIRYTVCDSIVTISMFLQIIVGASVTAFGAGSANHIIITVFGAANTALASLLAVLKSQGLPNRLRQDWNGWRELREFIEEKEREIEMAISGKIPGGKVIDVWAEIKGIEGRYSATRLTSEANRPDTYIKVPVPSIPQ